ncbi:MAG: DinB family protein [Gemmatimonadota bacterium]|nr:DinB family protein [Gemmatimonadota bacterium]
MIAQLDEASPPWCVRLIAELNAADERATALAKTLTPRQLNWTPAPGVWSVGQCLEHLCIANEVYLEAMSNSFADRHLAVVQDITPGWFGRWFIRNYIEPSSKTRRVRAPKKIRPGAQIEPSILDRFISSNHSARELVHRAKNYDVNRIRFKNPFISVIRFTVGTGLEIVSKHQRRHLLQAERIRESPRFPER